MNILYLSRWLPYPAHNGSKLRIYNLLTRLAAKGHKIHLITFYEQGENPQESHAHLQSFCASVDYVNYKPFQSKSWKARLAFFSLRPRSVIDTFQPLMQQKVEIALASGEIQKVIASEIDMAAYGFEAKRLKIPAILEELEVNVIREKYVQAKDVKERLRRGLTWLKLAAYIKTLARHYQAITVVSDVEKSIVQPLVGKTPVYLLPNGADLNNYNFYPYRLETRSNCLIFNGALTFALNYEAMQYFISKVFPIIRQTEPTIELIITGRHEGVDLTRLGDSQGVSFSGFVDDIRPLVAGSFACVAPLLQGGGTRLKILEAFSLGTPVVATSKGAEGLEASHNQHLLIADTPEAFAQAVLRLYREPTFASQLAQNARKLVEDKYNWDRVANQLHALIQE